MASSSDVTVWANFTAGDCIGLVPDALPMPISFQVTDSIASSPDFCGMPIGDGSGAVALKTLHGGRFGKPQWTILSSSGQQTPFGSGAARPPGSRPRL